MTLKVPDGSEEFLLDTILAVNYTLNIFKNDVESGLTPTQIQQLVVGSFTATTFTGYSSKALTGGSWTTTQADPSTGTYAQQIYTCSGAGSVNNYGWYLTRTTGGALVAYEYFDDVNHLPVVVAAVGDEIRITPRITLADTTAAG